VLNQGAILNSVLTKRAQREACEAYIRSHKHYGWTASPDYYLA
jgi:hypothetical protein